MGKQNLSIRVLLIMEALASAGQPLSFTQLIQRTKIPKSSLCRQVHALTLAGFITRLPGQAGYVVGGRALKLSLSSLRSSSFLIEAKKSLKKLVSCINESCNLTTLSGDSVQYLVREESELPWSLQLHVRPNVQVPLHCTASGKLFLANLPMIEQQNYLKRLELTAYTKSTITTREGLKAELENTFRQGFGIDNEEFVTGMVAIAVPVYGGLDKEELIAAVACHAVSARTDLRKLLSQRAIMQKAADDVGLIFNTTESRH